MFSRKFLPAIAVLILPVWSVARTAPNSTEKKTKAAPRVTVASAQAAGGGAPKPAQPLSTTCGKQVYLIGSSELKPDGSLPKPESYLRIVLPVCAEQGQDYVLHFKQNAFVLEAAPSAAPNTPPAGAAVAGPSLSTPQSGAADKKKDLEPPYSEIQIFALAFGIVAAGLLSAYLLWRFVLVPQVKSMVDSSIRKHQPVWSERNNANLSSLAENASKNILRSFTEGSYKQLADRVTVLERREAAVERSFERSSPSKTPVGSETMERTSGPPIVEVPRETGLEIFIRLFNQAKRQPSSAGNFKQKYQPGALKLTNTDEMAKNPSATPIFSLQDDGDLLTIRVNKVEQQESSQHFYVVPSYDKPWGTDRFTGGRWDYFLQITVDGGGATELIWPARVKFDGTSWELVDETSRGEISVDSHAS